MLQAALLGGVAIGVLSALPIVNIANCCCAWILLGGGLSAYLLQQNQPAPITAGDGALVGLAAGAIGAVVWSVLSIPIAAALGPFQAALIERTLATARDMPPEARVWLESMRGNSAVIGLGWFLGLIVMLIVGSLFAMLGGLFGALLVRRAAPPVPPVPPPAPPPLPLRPTRGPATSLPRTATSRSGSGWRRRCVAR
ncbi:MAG: hypothetical protein AB1635_11645, partial [Acidobacteriota bacterium]